ncbi:hypothetical protein D3C81_1731440 [compost metagenome]
MQRKARAGGQHAHQLLDDDNGMPEIAATTAVLFGDGAQQQAFAASLEPGLARHAAGLFPFVVVGRDLALDEFANLVAELFVIFTEGCSLIGCLLGILIV